MKRTHFPFDAQTHRKKKMTILDNVVRATNGVITLLGLALLSYGGYLLAQCRNLSNPISDAALALGFIDTLLGVLVLACGYRSLFILRLYGLVMSFLVLAELTVAIVFLVDKSKLDTTTCAGDQTGSFARGAAATPWIILAVAVFQTVTLVLVFMQVCSVDKPFDESALP